MRDAVVGVRLDGRKLGLFEAASLGTNDGVPVGLKAVGSIEGISDGASESISVGKQLGQDGLTEGLRVGLELGNCGIIEGMDVFIGLGCREGLRVNELEGR